MLVECGQVNKALADFAMCTKLLPHDATAHKRLAVTHLRLGNWHSANESYTKALEIDPSAGYMHKMRAWAHVNLKQHAEALADLKEALKLNPADTSTLHWEGAVGLAGTSAEFRQRVLDLAQDAVDKSPDRAHALTDRASLYCELSEWSKALVDLEAALKSDNPQPGTHYERALLLLTLGETKKYHNACAAMVEQFSQTKDPAAADFVAWACALAPAPSKTISPCWLAPRRRSKPGRDSDRFLNTLGAILHRASRHDEALERLRELERRLEKPDLLNAESAPAYAEYFLAMAHHKVGHAAEGKNT